MSPASSNASRNGSPRMGHATAKASAGAQRIRSDCLSAMEKEILRTATVLLALPPRGNSPPKDLDCLSPTASPPLTLPLRGGPDSLNLNLNQDADAGEARARERLVSDEAFKLADEITTLVGLDPKHPPPAWCGAAMHVAKWLRQGWDRELILVGARTAMARRSTAPHSIRYFEPAIAEELARQQAPLPKAEIPRTPEDQHAKPTERRSVTAVLREQLAAARG